MQASPSLLSRPQTNERLCLKNRVHTTSKNLTRIVSDVHMRTHTALLKCAFTPDMNTHAHTCTARRRLARKWLRIYTVLFHSSSRKSTRLEMLLKPPDSCYFLDPLV